MDKRKRLNSVDSGHDIEDMDDRPASSMSVEKDLGDSDEKVDVESPATPAAFLRPPRSSPSPFLVPQRPSVKTESVEQTSLVSTLVSSASSPLPPSDSREAAAKRMSPPVSSSTGGNGGGGGVVGGGGPDRGAGGVNIPILPHEPSLPPPQPPCLSPYSGGLPPTSSLHYPSYLYYSQFMHPIYLGRHPQLPLPPLPTHTGHSLDKATREMYSSYPYFRAHAGPHHSSLLGGPPRPVPIHSYSYPMPPQVPANL